MASAKKECPVCKRVFVRAGPYAKHILLCSPCPICGKTFARVSEKERHRLSCNNQHRYAIYFLIITQHTEELNRYNCETLRYFCFLV